MNQGGEILFYEKQKFKPWVRLLIFITTCGIFVTGLFVQLVLETPFGSNPLSSGGHLIGLLLTLLLSLLFESMKLETIITRNAVSVRFFPFIPRYRNFYWKDMEQVSIRKYDPLLEYGGWGLKGFKDDRALNIAGTTGLQLVFDKGKRLLIGTQKAEQMAEVMGRLGKELKIKNYK